MEQQPIADPRAPYPAPPPFWKHFTSANIAQHADLQSQDPPPTRLPLPLTYLTPPPVPPPSLLNYTTFTQPQPLTTASVLPPPEELLFDPESQPINHAYLLMKITKSLMLNFLHLMGILSQNPAEYEETIAHMTKLVLNAHVVINMYRPHQARENVMEMLLERLEDGNREIEEMEEKRVEVMRFLEEVKAWKERREEGAGDESRVRNVIGARRGEDEKARRLWEIMHGIADEEPET